MTDLEINEDELNSKGRCGERYAAERAVLVNEGKCKTK